MICGNHFGQSGLFVKHYINVSMSTIRLNYFIVVSFYLLGIRLLFKHFYLLRLKNYIYEQRHTKCSKVFLFFTNVHSIQQNDIQLLYKYKINTTRNFPLPYWKSLIWKVLQPGHDQKSEVWMIINSEQTDSIVKHNHIWILSILFWLTILRLPKSSNNFIDFPFCKKIIIYFH